MVILSTPRSTHNQKIKERTNSMADQKTTPEFKAAFIGMLGHLPNITAVCRLMGIDASNIHRARKKDEEFDTQVKVAVEEGYDMIEEEARRRAVDGVLEPVFHQGEQVGEIRKYSDALLKMLLKGYKPKRFNPGAKVSFGDGQKVSFSFNLEGDAD